MTSLDKPEDIRRYIEHGLFLLANNLMMLADQYKREGRPKEEIQLIEDLQDIADSRLSAIRGEEGRRNG